jgi:aarF domain-containing kinase
MYLFHSNHVPGLQNGSWGAGWGQNAFDQPQTDKTQTPESAREALKFVFSAEGAFFRDFIMDEVVRSIDAMSRAQLKALVNFLGLTGASIPLFLPGSLRFIPLTPDLNPEDRKVMENVKKLGNFLTGGDAAGLIGGSSDPRVMREITPFLPNVATEIAPEVFKRLASRLSARAVRELFVSSPP